MEATSTSPFKIILGSSSVARRKILAEMGYEFEIITADIDEKCIRKEKPEELVMALAEAKVYLVSASAKYGLRIQVFCKEKTICLGYYSMNLPVDSIELWWFYEGAVREKPSSEEEARHFMKGYSGRYAATVSSVLVTNLKTGFRKVECDRVEIYFHEIPDEVIEKLIEEGLVLRVAGGLIIEHPLILPYVKEVVGTTDSVMGLPKALTEKLVKEAL
ncbi:hypothetical protein GH714_015409 [Hevea brasiliensis]|uniref:Maf-like protein n=1 Tax=Hevea brasiliensis TaxID=3981 RepID=A0A6A6NHF0_HEVBR|nr:hypothetical protein GH714_015409 [Hevea brasiliensis]